MVKEPCPDPRLLLGAVPPGQADARVHPWADHLKNCPRCRALVLSHDAFLGDTLAEGSSGSFRGDEAAAAVRLDTVIAGLGSNKGRHRRPAWWLPLAAVFLVAVGVWSLVPRTGDGIHGGAPLTHDDGIRMRGGAKAPQWVAPAVSGDGGHTVVDWSPVPGADSYRVDVLAADLSLVLSFAAGTDTRWVLPAEGSSSMTTSGFVVVVALKGGQAIAQSPPAPLPSKK